MYLLNHEGFTVWITPMEFTFHYVSIKSIRSLWSHRTDWSRFTFHYVSIKSTNLLRLNWCLEDLHSTMYLLNLMIFSRPHVNSKLFTFHYVSIKSHIRELDVRFFLNLHSTMYLLNRGLSCAENCTWRIYIPLCIY